MDTPQSLHANDLVDYSTKRGSGIYEQGCKTLDNKALTSGLGMTPNQAVVFVQSLTRRATAMRRNTVSKQIITFTNRSENPKALRFLMATILRGTPWPIRGHRGPIICRRRKVIIKLENRNPAIMTATNGDFSLQLIVASISTDANQVAPATTICNDFSS
jgi:hypothetical protein